MGDICYMRKLSNPNALAEAQKVYNFICNSEHVNILSGQQESTWMPQGAEYEFDYIKNCTGKYPIIRGFDFLVDENGNDFSDALNRAVEWHKNGGIVTICHHCGKNFKGSWEDSQKDCVEDWGKLFEEGTAEHIQLKNGLDIGAEYLLKLQENNVPVLWRPYHEFDGKWFWWGKGGPENFKRLWRFTYNYYTYHWHLNNLIWVLGYSETGRENNNHDLAVWYPDDEYVDVCGADSYAEGPNVELYRKIRRIVSNKKPICLHECGKIPTYDEMKNSGAYWAYFMSWHTEWLFNNNTEDYLKKVYSDKHIITL